MSNYWAVVNAEETHIQQDTHTGQLEIYETKKRAEHILWPGTEVVEVHISKPDTIATQASQIAALEAENARLREEVASLTGAAKNVSDGHWHERTYSQMRPLIRAMDDAIDRAAEMLGGDG